MYSVNILALDIVVFVHAAREPIFVFAELLLYVVARDVCAIVVCHQPQVRDIILPPFRFNNPPHRGTTVSHGQCFPTCSDTPRFPVARKPPLSEQTSALQRVVFFLFRVIRRYYRLRNIAIDDRWREKRNLFEKRFYKKKKRNHRLRNTVAPIE